jgi:hypothetical protein
MRRFSYENIRKYVQYSFMSYKSVILMRLMTNLLTIHAKRVIIQAKNMQLLNQLRHSMTDFDMLSRFFRINIFVINKIRLRSQLRKRKLQNCVD